MIGMKERIPLHVAQIVTNKYIDLLKPFCTEIQAAGSVRRKGRTVGDIEVVCIPMEGEVPIDMFDSKMERVPGFGKTILEVATEIIKGKPHTGKYIQFMVQERIQLDLFVATKDNWGYIYLIRTGSADFSKFMAHTWVTKGFRGTGGSLTKYGENISTPTEKSIFDLLGLKVIPPHKRNQRGLPR